MQHAPAASVASIHSSLLGALDIHFRITVYLIENLDPAAWRSLPPEGKGRDIASLVAHIHGVHCMWLKAAGSAVIPPALDKATASPQEAITALKASSVALRELIAKSLETGIRVKNFKPDTVAFVGYWIAHDAHHRGQIAMLARQTGFPLPKSVNFGMWEWGVR